MARPNARKKNDQKNLHVVPRALPRRYLLEHILRGDSGDGVPNVLSPDNVFVDPNARQKPLKAKQINEWCDQFSKIDELMDHDTYRNFIRNRHCIDLSFIPEDVTTEIMETYSAQPETPKSGVFNYLIAKR